MKNLLVILLLQFNLICIGLFAQEFPPINAYEPIDYEAGNQNWMIDQDPEGNMYFANNDGLLVFDGASWTTYPTTNQSILRSVKVIGDKIFTGCYMEVGFWEKQDEGRLRYTSLNEIADLVIMEDEQFWNIAYHEPFILFQSLDRILIYNQVSKEIKTIDAPMGVTRMFHPDGKVFFHSSGEGLFMIDRDRAQRVIDDPRIAQERIAKMIPRPTGYLLITQKGGIFDFNTETRGLIKIKAPDALENTGIYHATELSNGNIAFGTISEGLVVTNPDLQVVYHINQLKGLGNNTILSLKEDADNNLWLGLDNGITTVNLEAPIKRYLLHSGKIGTVYASAKKDGVLYLGTNQGLFYKGPEDASYQLIEGTKSQVWSLFTYDDTLFCGHDYGTFVVEGNRATLISDVTGTWDFRTVPGRPDLILQGNYNGFNLLKKEGGFWRYFDNIDGFTYSSKHFEIIDGHKIYMSHEYKGVYELTLDSSLLRVKSFIKLDQPGKGRNSGLARFEDHIYYTNREGVYGLDTRNPTGFVKDSLLSSMVSGKNFVSGKMVNDGRGNLWFFTRDYLLKMNRGLLSDKPNISEVPVPYDELRTITGYEHILGLGNEKYLVGSKDGYLSFNINKIRNEEYDIFLKQVAAQEPGTEEVLLDLDKPATLSYKNNHIRFQFAVPEFQKYVKTSYQYMLEGYHDEWSAWTEDAEVNFENLPFGHYVFRVRGRVGAQPTSGEVEYGFEILPPWYFSMPALAAYLGIFVLGALFVNNRYKRYYDRKQQQLMQQTEEKHRLEQLENEQELSRLRNEKLKQDVDSKSKELAASTMSVIRKNEFLIEIRDRLKKLNGNGEKQIRAIISSINKDIDEEDNWSMFEEAFNNTDKDFLKRIKEVHPKLTPNDLRLCAYLRLNLSSKEIAPLLNISVRSVEIKRYRLRKKMDLAHETGLVEYILSV
ncbi:triple tyrosine motif-containing protein [Robertkochia sediminum]|uniref:triple tyrosine motif-containing protein n=1 Tax=Robertkochia sediminum TaxID=2785326 RepID=UPI00193282A4|nr:triple tyrosine motif-containing protein [Robertkochia sediminum]MBL7473975.1 LuxR family transcriptional regulator [Robertkochia sediminum]